jgi:TolB-like protein
MKTNLVQGALIKGVALLAALSLSTLAGAKTVTVKGEAAVEGGNKAAARKAALKDAFRKAVEEVAGVHVQSTTIASEWEIVKDEIVAKTEGMVTSHKVLSEGDNAGVYEVTISADVADKPVGDAIGQLINLKKSSKVAFLVAEKMAGNADFAVSTSSRGKTEDILVNMFQERGFPVVDLSGLAGLSLSTGAKQGEIGAADAQAIAERADAQYVIVGKAEGRDAGGIEGTAMHSYQMTVTLRMFAVSNHEIIATATESRPVLSVSPDFGNAQAIKQYKERVIKIAKRWTEEEQTGTKRIQLVVNNVPNYKVLKELATAVGAFKGVAKSTQRGLTNKVAKIDVEVEGDADALAEQLSGAKLSGYKAEVTEVDEGRIVVNVTK